MVVQRDEPFQGTLWVVFVAVQPETEHDARVDVDDLDVGEFFEVFDDTKVSDVFQDDLLAYVLKQVAIEELAGGESALVPLLLDLAEVFWGLEGTVVDVLFWEGDDLEAELFLTMLDEDALAGTEFADYDVDHKYLYVVIRDAG